MLDDGPPQDQHIDPGISALRGSIARHGERRLDRCRPPRLDPGDTAGLQFGDDLVGDFGVKARAVVAAAEDREVCLDIAVLRDGRRKPLLRSSTRRADPARALTLSHGDAACTLGNGIGDQATVFTSGMEAQRAKTREAWLQCCRQPGPAREAPSATEE